MLVLGVYEEKGVARRQHCLSRIRFEVPYEWIASLWIHREYGFEQIGMMVSAHIRIDVTGDVVHATPMRWG